MGDVKMRIRITRVIAPGELAAQVERPMRNAGNAIGRRMQRLVPKRTWALHDTIKTSTERRGGKVVTTVGAGGTTSSGKRVTYALHVERGTSTMAAQPYMRPALLQTKSADLNYSGDGPVTHGVGAR